MSTNSPENRPVRSLRGGFSSQRPPASPPAEPSTRKTSPGTEVRSAVDPLANHIAGRDVPIGVEAGQLDSEPHPSNFSSQSTSPYWDNQSPQKCAASDIRVFTPLQVHDSALVALTNSSVMQRIDSCYTPDEVLTLGHRAADLQFQIGSRAIISGRSAAWLWSGYSLPHWHELTYVTSSQTLVELPRGWRATTGLSPIAEIVDVVGIKTLSPISTALSLILRGEKQMKYDDLLAVAGMLVSKTVRSADLIRKATVFQRAKQITGLEHMKIWGRLHAVLDHVSSLFPNPELSEKVILSQIWEEVTSQRRAEREKRYNRLAEAEEKIQRRLEGLCEAEISRPGEQGVSSTRQKVTSELNNMRLTWQQINHSAQNTNLEEKKTTALKIHKLILHLEQSRIRLEMTNYEDRLLKTVDDGLSALQQIREEQQTNSWEFTGFEEQAPENHRVITAATLDQEFRATEEQLDPRVLLWDSLPEQCSDSLELVTRQIASRLIDTSAEHKRTGDIIRKLRERLIVLEKQLHNPPVSLQAEVPPADCTADQQPEKTGGRAKIAAAAIESYGSRDIVLELRPEPDPDLLLF